MKRKTSAEAFQKIKDEGLLSKRRLEVYETLYTYGPMTGMELLMRLKRTTNVDSQVRARLNELRELGVAEEVGEVRCSITKMHVIQWDVTDRLPERPRKTASDCVECPWCKGKGVVKLTPREVTTVVHYDNQGVQLDIFGANL